VIMPTTWLAELTSGPPESPGLMGASVWMRPLSCSDEVPSVVVIDWSSATTVPWVTLGVPLPRALPIATNCSSTVRLEESAIVAGAVTTFRRSVKLAALIIGAWVNAGRADTSQGRAWGSYYDVTPNPTTANPVTWHAAPQNRDKVFSYAGLKE